MWVSTMFWKPEREGREWRNSDRGRAEVTIANATRLSPPQFIVHASLFDDVNCYESKVQLTTLGLTLGHWNVSQYQICHAISHFKVPVQCSKFNTRSNTLNTSRHIFPCSVPPCTKAKSYCSTGGSPEGWPPSSEIGVWNVHNHFRLL